MMYTLKPRSTPLPSQAKTEAAKQGSEQPATPQFVISLKTTMAITLMPMFPMHVRSSNPIPGTSRALR